MKRTIVLGALVFVALLLAAAGVSVRNAAAQAPPDVPRGISGGRPGIFRFIPREQLQAERAELTQLRASLERIRAGVSTIQDPAQRRQLDSDLDQWQIHLDRTQQRMTTSASSTAQMVELQLNDIKGQRMCGMC